MYIRIYYIPPQVILVLDIIHEISFGFLQYKMVVQNGGHNFKFLRKFLTIFVIGHNFQNHHKIKVRLQ